MSNQWFSEIVLYERRNCLQAFRGKSILAVYMKDELERYGFWQRWRKVTSLVRNIFNYFFEFCLFDQLVSPTPSFDAKPRYSRPEIRKPFAHRSLASKVQCTRNVSKPFAIRERTFSRFNVLRRNVDEYCSQYTFRIDDDVRFEQYVRIHLTERSREYCQFLITAKISNAKALLDIALSKKFADKSTYIYV